MEKKPPLDTLIHYGVKRKSGRYPWGSGEDAQQHENQFLRTVDDLRAKGINDTDIANKLGMTTTQLRNNITWANKEQREALRNHVVSLKEEGLSNVAIADKLGVSEATVRNYQSIKEKVEKVQLDTVTKAIEQGVANTGYLDVGVGVERQLGVSRNKFNTVVNKLVSDGDYHIHEVYVKRLSDPTGKTSTTVKVLTKDPDQSNTVKNSDKIRPLDAWSDDNGQTLNDTYPPHMMSLNRIKVRYAEDGGAAKDGLIELRPGREDLDLGRSRYAQVRIAAGDDLYLKGMAAYSDESNFPKGVDIIFNTNKTKDVPVDKVLKKMKMTPKETDDPSAMFGSSVMRQKGALNIVNEQGDWAEWSKNMSSQFLSKQSLTLIKDRLDDTYSGLKREFDEINSMTNPIVKKYLMESYIDGLDAKANHLKAKGLPNTRNHVLLPFPDMKPNEIYAPNYKDGDRVVLVRHPHGGKFEIPDLVVNNKHSGAKKMIGNDSPDAVGIHPSVAEKLSGADFDGDTVLVIPNNTGQVKTSRSLKELKNWADEMHVLYKRDYETIAPRTKQIQMGVVSNLITDMSIKGASDSELARAVRHSMVVIDSEKHKLDYKQSARDHGISALVKKYQTHINPDTGKVSKGASTLISRSKQRIDLSQHETARDLARDRVKDGKVVKKGMSVSEIATKLKISEDTVEGYLRGETFNPDKYSSGYAREELYNSYIKGVIGTKNEATKAYQTITPPKYSKEAAKLYAPERESLDAKLNTALLNAPRERQAQILTAKLFYSNFNKDMEPDAIKKLKARSLAKARIAVGAKKTQIEVTEKEWEAIQAGAISNTKLLDILKNADMDIIRKLASPRELKLSSAKATRARTLLNNGYTLSEVANTLGVSTTTLREELK